MKARCVRRATALVVVAAGLSAGATDFNWIGGESGEWTEAANWSPSTGYPNGADDSANFELESAATVTVTSESVVTVKGLRLTGPGALTLRGSGLALGEAGIYSTSADTGAVVTVENPIALSAAKTVVSNLTAAVHLKGVVSGAGGILKGGAARLHLYGDNTFAGGMFVEGTHKTPTGANTSASGSVKNGVYVFNADPGDSSGVVAYHAHALGTGKATFDAGYSGDKGSGTRLTFMNCSGTVPNEIMLPNDTDHICKSTPYNFEIYGGDLTFTGTVDCDYRPQIRILSRNTVRFTKTVTHGNYLMFRPMVNGSAIHLDAPISGSCEFYGNATGASRPKIHLCATNSVGVNLFMQAAYLVLDCDYALPSKLGYDFYWENNDAVIDLNGYRQKITSWTVKNGNPKKYPNAQITSPENKPAQIFCQAGSDNDFTCRFTGSAGFVWNPTQDKTLIVSNSISTTCGEIRVTNGTVAIVYNSKFTRLGKLTVEGGATFRIGSDAGDLFKVSKLVAASGANFDIQGSKRLTTGKMFVNAAEGTVEVPSGTILTKGDQLYGLTVTGDGSIYVTGEGAPTYWKGPNGGLWNDPNNWSSGAVPDSGSDAYVTNAATVVVNAAMPRVRAIYVGDGIAAARLLATNMNSTISAEQVVVMSKGVITCGAAATNETDLSRVHIVCKNLEIQSGGSIDVSAKGWGGGIWELKHDNVAKHAIQATGYGPAGGDGNANGGACHGGRGASGQLTSSIPRHTYGDAAQPTEHGSGGGVPTGYGGTTVGNFVYGAAGGGVVRIEATGSVIVNGSILADGVKCDAGMRDTPGAGGSIWITCRTVSGAGTIRAAGGAGDDPRIPVLAYRGLNNTETDSRYAPAAGGGRIAIAYDSTAQASANGKGLMISGAAGDYQKGGLTLATRDNEESAAEPGTLHFTDGTLVRALFGNGLTGRIVGLKELSFEGDLAFTRGFIVPMEEGFSLSVAGNLTVSGAEARLEIGGVLLTNLASRATVWGGRQVNRLTVGGDFTVEKGGSFLLRAAETNGTMRWGAEALVTGAMTIGSNGCVYAACDGVNLGAPWFRVGSLKIVASGTLSADRRGGLGSDMRGISHLLGYQPTEKGFGFGGGVAGGSASHGGYGASGWLGTTGMSQGTRGELYDNPWLPTLPGSGGGSVSSYADAGTGGGLVFVVAEGAVEIDGKVSADGWCGSQLYSNQHNIGAGSGGTVFICGETLFGAATAKITAAGGSSLQSRGIGWSATGGGGCVALWTGSANYLAGKCHKNRHNVKPAAFLGDVSAAPGGFLYPNLGPVTVPDDVAPRITGQAGTVRYGTFEPPSGCLFFVR